MNESKEHAILSEIFEKTGIVVTLERFQCFDSHFVHEEDFDFG